MRSDFSLKIIGNDKRHQRKGGREEGINKALTRKQTRIKITYRCIILVTQNKNDEKGKFERKSTLQITSGKYNVPGTTILQQYMKMIGRTQRRAAGNY